MESARQNPSRRNANGLGAAPWPTRAFVRVAVNVPSLAGGLAGREPNAASDGPRTSQESTTPAAFDYAVPEHLSGRLGVGHLVLVPFGTRTVQGVVLSGIDQPGVPKTKEVIALVDPEPVLTAAQIALAEWMAESTLGSIASIVGLFLPPGLSQQADTVFRIRESGFADQASQADGESKDAKQDLRKSIVVRRLLELLQQRGALRGRQIDRALPRLEWRRTAQYLVRRGVLGSDSVLPPAIVRPKFIRTAQIAVPPETAESAMPDIGSTEATRSRRQKALRYLISRPDAINVSWIYAESGCNLADLQELADRELIALREQEVWRDPLQHATHGGSGGDEAEAEGHRFSEPVSAPQELILTADQQSAWQVIETGLRNRAAGSSTVPSFLVQGVTGSGKTELYLLAARAAAQAGRQIIVLVPEISLTPQTVRRFLAYFPGQVGLIHSGLSPGERYDTWRRARAGALRVVIGPRSALFAPLQNLGLLIVDECHDASYDQSEPPYFHAVAAAQAYARLCGGICIMGSATPAVTQRYQAELGQSVRLELRQRVASAAITAPAPILDLPSVQVVDMREELKAGNRSSFSRELSEALASVLKRGEQAILFLNRRGTATYVFCRNCGYVVRCPRCDTPLTYHVLGGERLLCHRCGYVRQMPKKCPGCGSSDIRAYGLGTEKVEAEVQRAFPNSSTLRWDWETTRQKYAHETILGHFAACRADVLIGTQMLAKGLDLPRVTLVGIVLADVGLFLPDPFAAERSFQTLTQVAGRSGRSTRGGRVVLQTFVPEHYAIQAAARHDVNGFYLQELAQRRRLGFPPFSRLLRMEYRHYDAQKAEKEARDGAAALQRLLAARGGRTEAALIGPAPCFYSRVDGKYRWQIVLRGAEFATFLDARRFASWRIEVDPVSLL
jgi:primosomal protein N' (replication factor Y)